MPGCPRPGRALGEPGALPAVHPAVPPAGKDPCHRRGYADVVSDDAFFRMFERDKTELRELGVPWRPAATPGSTPPTATASPATTRAGRDRPRAGRGGRGRAGRPPVGDPGPGGGGARRGAQAARGRGGGRRDGLGAGAARVRAVEPAFGPLLAAVQAGQVVTFPHRRGGPTGGVHAADRGAVGGGLGAGPLVPGGPRPRPGGRPLLPALPDHGAGDDARRAGWCEVPPGVDLLAVVDRGVALPPVIGTARLWVAAGRAHGLRRLGRVRRPLRLPGTGDGDELEIDLRSLDTVARWVAGYGPGRRRCTRRSWRPRSAGRGRPSPPARSPAQPDPDPGPALAPAGRRSPG